jgi:biopolymer transport protein ExbB/TolQ
MGKVCFLLSDPSQCAWNLAYLWRFTNWLTRMDVFVLGFLLAYVLVLLGVVSYRYNTARRQWRACVQDAAHALHRGAFDELVSIAARVNRRPTVFLSTPSGLELTDAIDIAELALQRGQATLVRQFKRRARSVRAIGWIAPFLGLAGTIIGLLSSFPEMGIQKDIARAIVVTYVSAAMIPTLAGLVVAIVSVASYNFLCARIERLASVLSARVFEATVLLRKYPHSEVQDRRAESFSAPARLAQKFPLRSRVSEIPAFAILATPALAIALTTLMLLGSYWIPKGLDVLILRTGQSIRPEDSSSEPLTFKIAGASRDRPLTISMKSQKMTLDQLDDALAAEVSVHTPWAAYVEAETTVPWAAVETVIDKLKTHGADVVLKTTRLDASQGSLEPDHGLKATNKRKLSP